jgi:hypothetical protein
MLESRSEVSIQFTTPVQLAFLRAALMKERDAIESAEECLISEGVELGAALDRLEPGLRRLLPLLYRNARGSIAAELQPKLKALYIQSWEQNQKLIGRLQKLLAWFQANGVPSLVLKGLALSLLHYRDLGVRPTSDLDVLVPEERAREVIELLQRNGWTTDYILLTASKNSYFYRHIHAIPLRHPEFGELDLHWHVLQTATSRGSDRSFWTDSVALQVNTVASRALNPTDQLLHACLHGFAANVVAPIRWIADAITVFRTSQIDWQRLVNIDKLLHVTVPLGVTLSFLHARFHTEIPAGVLGELMSFSVDRSDQRYFEKLASLHKSWREIVAYNCERHRRANRGLHSVLRLALMPRDLGSFAFYRLGKQITRKLATL